MADTEPPVNLPSFRSGKPDLQTPDRLLPGEKIILTLEQQVTVFLDAGWKIGTLFITNFQMIFRFTNGKQLQAPLTLIKSIGKKILTQEYTQIKLKMKDFRILKFCIEGSSIAEFLVSLLSPYQQIDSITKLFAFDFKFPVSKRIDGWLCYDSTLEYERMGVFPSSEWRITYSNSEYNLCSSYPKDLCVPSKVKGNQLLASSRFRAGGRFPVLAWKHPIKSIAIMRSGQPFTGITGARCLEDEKIIQYFNELTKYKGICIIDCRPKTNAVANQMKGGGYENSLYYEGCEVIWAGIPNIHTLNDSWTKLFKMIQNQPPSSSWLSTLESTQWLWNVHILLKASQTALDQLIQTKSILVHCSDGWDRTPSVISLTELLIDSYYRTLDGFIVLIEKDWLSFGHPFGERSGTDEKLQNDSKAKKKTSYFSPVFLLFIDCVFQLLRQFPMAFQFNSYFLIVILDACYSCQYGTFLCNTEKERKKFQLQSHTVSLWTIINSNRKPFINDLYQRTTETLYPTVKIKDLVLWEDFYLRGWRVGAVFSNLERNLEDLRELVRNKDSRIQELEKELRKYRPELGPDIKNLFIQPILNEIIGNVIKILNSNLSKPKISRSTSFPDIDMEVVVSTDYSYISETKSKEELLSNGMNQKNDPNNKSQLRNLDPKTTPVTSISPTMLRRRSLSITDLPSETKYDTSFQTAPKWVPDDEVSFCPICKTQFTSFKRKHHCRNCGNIFCGACCFEKIPIRKYGYFKPVKVCTQCFRQISTTTL